MLFPKVNKIIVHISLFSTAVCVIGWIWEKKFVCILWLSVHTVWNQPWNKDFSTNLHSTTRCLKHSSNFESV